MALSEQEMEVLLQNETGLAMADFNHRIGWYYLPTYGAFAKEVSDTNFKQIEVQDVYYNKAADVYSVLYRTPGRRRRGFVPGNIKANGRSLADHGKYGNLTDRSNPAKCCLLSQNFTNCPVASL